MFISLVYVTLCHTGTFCTQCRRHLVVVMIFDPLAFSPPPPLLTSPPPRHSLAPLLSSYPTHRFLVGSAQFVNLFLFFVGVSFVLAAVIMVMATAPLKARWDTYANANLEV